MAKSAFQQLTLDEDTMAALIGRAPDLPLDAFIYAVSRYVAPDDKVTPEQVRYELGGRDAEPLRGVASRAAALQGALSDRSQGASDFLVLAAHRHGMPSLVSELRDNLSRFLNLCEMARREADAAVHPGRKYDANTELVADLANGILEAGKVPDAKDGGSLVQAFDIAQAVARKELPGFQRVNDPAGTVRKALARLRPD